MAPFLEACKRPSGGEGDDLEAKQFEKAPGASFDVGEGNETNSALRYFNFRKATIYAGSNEIQRNIIAKHLLGL